MIVRRIAAALLANVMVFTTAVQTITAGAETGKSAAENVSLSNDEINVESTNSFGSILAKEISAEQEEQLANNGCNVFSIEMDGTQANVEFQTVAPCTLVVGVYDESGETLLATGSTEVLHDQTRATVSIEIDEMPKYFYLKGYLIDSLGLAPMCTVYKNPNYTQKMQEFFSKTVDDFDAERVLNFDDDLTNNFAVYEESTILIPQNNEGYNVVASADDAACMYVIENADDSFLSLEEGDIFAYQYGENDLLIARIARMEVDGTTVTITGGGVSMDEIFEYVRIDIQQNMDDAEITPAEGAEVVDENADVIKETSSDQTTSSAKLSKANEPIDEDSDYLDGLLDTSGLELSYTLDAKYPNRDENEIDFMEEYFEGSVEVSGGVDFKAGVSFREYIAEDIDYTELLIGFSCGFSITASGSVALKFPIGVLGFSPIKGLIIEITPAIILRVDKDLELSGKWYGSAGVRFNLVDGISENISRAPVFKAEVKNEVSIFFGVDLQPRAKVIHEKVLNLEITSEVGVEAIGKMEGSLESKVEPIKSYHACKSCINGDFNFRLTLNAKLELANNIFHDPITIDILGYTKKFDDFYYTFDYKKFGFGHCPHMLYKVELQYIDLSYKPIEGVSLIFSSPDRVMIQTSSYGCSLVEDALLTDADGKAVVYLCEGTTAVHATKERFNDRSSNVIISVSKGGSIDINGKKTNQHEIMLSPVEHKVSIHVTDEAGEPLSMVEISKIGSTEYTDMDGNAELELSNGTYELTVSRNSYRTQTHTITIFDEGQDLTFKLVAIPDFYVRVVDEDGQPLQNATVLISGIYQPNSQTDADGICEIQLEEGDYTTIVSKENYETKRCEFTFNADFRSLEVVLKSTLPKVTVTVEDEQGKRIAGASVTYAGSEDAVLTGANGTAVLRIPQGDRTIKASAKGYRFKSQTCTVEAEGTVVTIILPPPMEFTVSPVACGFYGSGALKKDGSLYIWGDDRYGLIAHGPIPTKIMDNVSAFDIGNFHAAAIKMDGSLYLWGSNFDGQLGDGNIGGKQLTFDAGIDSGNPIKIMENVVSVSLEEDSSIAITEDGSLFQWGDAQPKPIKMLDNVRGFSYNGWTTAAITKDGSLYQWETFNGDYIPTPSKIMDNVTEVNLGKNHSAAITEDGSLYMWGSNGDGQLGNGTTEDSSTPIKIMDNVAAFSLGWNHSAAITEDGSLYMWGCNYYGQLGNGSHGGLRGEYDAGIDSATPIKIMDNVVAVSLEEYYSAAITEDGSLYMWGYNYSGELGNGSIWGSSEEYDAGIDSDIPIKIMDNVVSVILKSDHSAAITEDGSLYMWGYNYFGQLGDGTTKSSPTPIKIMDGVAIGGSTAVTSLTAEALTNAAKSTVPLATSGTAATKSYTDLLPDTLYNFYVLRSDTAENPLSADNLLYLNQYVSANDGTLDITYTPIEDVADAVMLAVPAQITISGTSIVLEDMVYDGTTQTASPVVSYGGVSLTEGTDYTLSGDTTAKEVGAYTLTITGTGDYTGELTLSYWMYCEHSYTDGICTICGGEEPVSYLLGDLDEDGQVNAVDAAMILVAAASVGSGGESGLTETQELAADVNGDGECNAVDAAEVLRYAAAVGSGYTGSFDDFFTA